MKNQPLIIAAILLAISSSCTPDAIEADEVLANIDKHIGKRLTLKGKFRSGARCRVQNDKGEFPTYCKNNDCQYCKGPVVLDTGLNTAQSGLLDWPIVLGGTWKGKDIRCRGPIDNIECWPTKPGKTYIVRGRLENQKPPKLIVADIREAD